MLFLLAGFCLATHSDTRRTALTSFRDVRTQTQFHSIKLKGNFRQACRWLTVQQFGRKFFLSYSTKKKVEIRNRISREINRRLVYIYTVQKTGMQLLPLRQWWLCHNGGGEWIIAVRFAEWQVSGFSYWERSLGEKAAVLVKNKSRNLACSNAVDLWKFSQENRGAA